MRSELLGFVEVPGVYWILGRRLCDEPLARLLQSGAGHVTLMPGEQTGVIVNYLLAQLVSACKKIRPGAGRAVTCHLADSTFRGDWDEPTTADRRGWLWSECQCVQPRRGGTSNSWCHHKHTLVIVLTDLLSITALQIATYLRLKH